MTLTPTTIKFPSKEQATVYRSGGRRFFTRHAAIRRYAIDRIRERYACECEPEVGFTCGMHVSRENKEDRWIRLVNRYTKFLMMWTKRGHPLHPLYQFTSLDDWKKNATTKWELNGCKVNLKYVSALGVEIWSDQAFEKLNDKSYPVSVFRRVEVLR